MLNLRLLALVFIAAPLNAEESKKPDPLFQDTATLTAVLAVPMSALLREKPTEDYVEGTFTYLDTDGKSHTLNVKVRARGHSRLDLCTMPPLWLNFKKSQVKDTLFHKQDKMKLGVHCGESLRHEQSVLREYLAYRVLNILTPLSFNVRLLRLTYVDSEGNRKDVERYAFLMEHKNRLGKRIGRDDPKFEETTVEAIDPEHLNLTSVFQFFIGNTDFSPIASSPYNECCHNYVMFGNEGEPLIAIPYDFDQTGFVNAPYASPGEQFPIHTVRQRLYRGRCANNELLDATLARFWEAQPAIDALIAEHEGLSGSVRKSLHGFVKDFYKIVSNPKHVNNRLVKRCM